MAREGWLCRYMAGGASLRSWSNELRGTVQRYYGVSWIAVEDLPSYEPADAHSQRVLGMMRKILTRGSAPPVPPAVERRILDDADVPYRDSAGTLSPTLVRRLPQEAMTLWRAAGSLESGLISDSVEESIFLHEHLAPALGASGSFITPQAPLDQILRGRGLDAVGDRRVDFLVPTPSGHKVVEVDGIQHSAAQEVDDERDQALASVGIPAVRIPASAVRSGATDALGALEVSLATSEPHVLSHGAVQAHRLMLSLLEGVATGFLAGDTWVVSVECPLESWRWVSAYLDVFAAVDTLWGGDICPQTVAFRGNGQTLRLTRDGLRFQESAAEVGDEPADVVIRLQTQWGPLVALPESDVVPAIVIRSADLPVALLESAVEPAERVPPHVDEGRADEALELLLQSVFAKPGFREGQLEAVREVLHGRDCAVLLPTGAGKSLIYQLAGLCLPGRTLVVDPLVALIEDQIEGLRSHGIDRAVGISSQTTASGDTVGALEQVAAGDALFIFVAPERLQQQSFRDALRELSAVTPINLGVVDEAHCVSEWGHDFRTSYLNLGRVLRRVCRDSRDTAPPLLALTGTASRAVLRDVLNELTITNQTENSLVKPATFDRPELAFDIRRTMPGEASATLSGVLRALPGAFAMTANEFYRARGDRTMSGVVFVPHVNGDYGVTTVAQRITALTGSPTPFFSGSAPRGMEAGRWETVKRDNARRFKSNEAPVLVATKAFGMGIDKPNIRYVVHYGIPGSIESYYQEVGRAGRDREPARCVLVFSEFDESHTRRILDEDADLQTAREGRDRTARADADDVQRMLFFHLNTFTGVTEELAQIADLIDVIGDLDLPRSVAVPMSADRGSRERALHRLVILGVVDDYLVDWGGKKFDLRLSGGAGHDIITSFLTYVEMSQPGRVPVIRRALDERSFEKPREVVLACAELLIEFVYDTVERARRRSLREMWLAARECSDDAQLRQRILEYLTEGDIAPLLERLIDDEPFTFESWYAALDSVATVEEAREWRGGAARLLGSYPDHPGLLLARALAEAFDPSGELREFSSNIEAAIRSAHLRYDCSASDLESLVEWLLRQCARSKHAEAAAVATASALAAGALPESAVMDAVAASGVETDAPTFAAVLLPSRLRNSFERIAQATTEGAWT